jgi:hypothetical protein
VDRQLQRQRQQLPASSACGDPGSSVVIPAVAPGKIYYTDSPLPDVFKANLDGSNPQTIPGPWAGAVDSSRMYYATLQGSQIWAANLDGTNVQTIASPVELDYPARRVTWRYTPVASTGRASAAARPQRSTRPPSRHPGERHP